MFSAVGHLKFEQPWSAVQIFWNDILAEFGSQEEGPIISLWNKCGMQDSQSYLCCVLQHRRIHQLAHLSLFQSFLEASAEALKPWGETRIQPRRLKKQSARDRWQWVSRARSSHLSLSTWAWVFFALVFRLLKDVRMAFGKFWWTPSDRGYTQYCQKDCTKFVWPGSTQQ